MSKRQAILAVTCAVALLMGSGSAAASPTQDGPTIGATGHADEYDATGAWAGKQPGSDESDLSSASDSRVTVQYARLADQMCGIADNHGGAMPVVCANPGIVDVACDEGETHLDPLFRRTWSDGVWGDWELVEGPSCVVGEADLAAAAAEEFRRVRVARPVLHVQPAGRALVNKPVIVFADASTQSFEVELLGVPVELEATPVRYAWSFGDGSGPVTTTSPGHGYPDQDVTHTYAHPGKVAVSVATSWSGRFRVRGAAQWEQIEGEVTTTSAPVGLEVVEARTHLVEDTTG